MVQVLPEIFKWVIVGMIYLSSLLLWKRWKQSKEFFFRKDEMQTKHLDDLLTEIRKERDMYKDMYQNIHNDLLAANKELASLRTEVNLLRQLIKKNNSN